VNRDELRLRVEQHAGPWDFIIIGGGATGAGVAVDAASRGYSVLLLEQSDFGKGTSSRSTKLVHGGVRYLEQGNISLVMEALKERGLLRQNAPHLVSNLPFVVPNYDWWEAPFYGIGLKVYNLLAGKYGFGQSSILSREETLERLPTIRTEGLRGGVVYYDGQFDDARLLINLMQTAVEHGAVPLNYVQVVALTKRSDGTVEGIVARDVETGREFRAHANVVINATGPFSDSVRRLAEPDAQTLIAPSQGIHLVFDRSFLPVENAIMVPHTKDGRVMFAGIRPLVRSGDNRITAALSRDHTIHIDASGLLTTAGGKWTTYRHMAEDTVNHAVDFARLPEAPCPTAELRIHGYLQSAEAFGPLRVYGADAPALHDLARSEPSLADPLDPALPDIGAQVVWAARMEMARTVEDVLARRCRALFLNAAAAVRMAPAVAALLARELRRDEEWQERQIAAFSTLARHYMVS
jgi:glycerol-3-phosphate dehydrogenase